MRQIGKGGMGAVYQADDAHIGKTWAIKEISDAAITDPLEKQQAHVAFRQEALMLANLSHPNLPKVADHFTDGNKQYLVMDFIEGETLADKLECQNGPLPVDVVVGWAEQLCDVLDYLHNRQPPVIFRDLKPANVMITPEGLVKLIDFGIARIFKPGQAIDTAHFGTAGYAPKEQYGKGQTDARSDVYALGAMLHHLLTGVDPIDRPFHFDDVLRLNDQVPIHVADAVMKALADDPSVRWQSVAEMRATLIRHPISQPEPPPALHQLPSPQLLSPSATQPKMISGLRPALTTASSAETAVPQPTPAPVTLHLNLWRRLGLILLGAALYSVATWLAGETLWQYDSPILAFFVWIPTLFGVLFGSWIGSLSGVLGLLAWNIRVDAPLPMVFLIALSHGVPGLLSGAIVKGARNWKTVLGASIVASGAYILSASATLITIEGQWGEFWHLASRFSIATLPGHIVFLPLARWLARLVRRWGLYWQSPQNDQTE
jgi:serine/threonine-protein kinase